MTSPKTYFRNNKAEWLLNALFSLFMLLYHTLGTFEHIVNIIVTYAVAGILLAIAAIPVLLLFVNPWQDTVQSSHE